MSRMFLQCFHQDEAGLGALCVCFMHHAGVLAKCSCIYYRTQRFWNKHFFFCSTMVWFSRCFEIIDLILCASFSNKYNPDIRQPRISGCPRSVCTPLNHTSPTYVWLPRETLNQLFTKSPRHWWWLNYLCVNRNYPALDRTCPIF